MRFKTLSEYDDEIKKIDEILDNFKEYIENHPKDVGVKTNRMSLMYIREELKKERYKMSICGEEIRRLESELEDCNADMELYKKKSNNIIKFLNNLYESIDENYTETLENNDELAIVRAEAQLNLVTSIISEVERI